MKADYVSGQGRLNTLLDTCHFDCVSSALEFTIVAHRLDIPVVNVIQPGHFFSRVPGYDGQTIDGEMYSYDRRAEEIRKLIEEDHHDLGGYTADRRYHETNDFGPLTTIDGKSCVDERGDKDYDQAVIDALKYDCLETTESGSGNKLESSFKSWFNTATANHGVMTVRAIANLYRQITRDPGTANKTDQCIDNLARQLAWR
jgi:hypothetical protein